MFDEMILFVIQGDDTISSLVQFVAFLLVALTTKLSMKNMKTNILTLLKTVYNPSTTFQHIRQNI